MSYAEDERLLLNHYNLTSINPIQWPYNAAEEVQPETRPEPKDKYHRRRTVLGRRPSLRKNKSDSQVSVGKGNVVQKDEPDPLGTSDSVMQTLRYRGLPVEEDLVLRNQFLLSSTTFSPSRYLAEVHSDASTDQLMRGLNYLSGSIEKKSASLKVLVESNFERFVKAKSAIDNVYREMRNHGAEAEQPRKPHARQTSRTIPHFRTGSGQGPTSPSGRTVMNEKRRHALIKESEYGTLGLKLPLLDASVKAEEIWGPTLGSRDKEESLKSVLLSMEQNRELFESASIIDDCIRRGEYETLVEEYGRVQKYAAQARALADKSEQDPSKLPDVELHQIIITARVWMDVQEKTKQVRSGLWTKLMNTHPNSAATGYKSDEYVELISTLLQLGVDENPITAWLQSQQYHLQHKISTTFDRSRIELEILRRRLAKNGRTSATLLANHLRAASNATGHMNNQDADMNQVIAYWEKLEASIEALLSTKNGILGEVIEFWDITKAFIDGKKQRSLPVGIDGQSRKHHHLDRRDVENLQRAPSSLFSMVRDQLSALFLQDPVVDVSSLLSPIPPTPITPATPASVAATPSKQTKFNFRPEDVPPPSPSVGESWEKLAFWPPYSNSLSASVFLGRIILLVSAAAGEMASIDPFRKDEAQVSSLRLLVSDVRERFTTATCAAWVTDSENCRELETWTRAVEKPDVTDMPAQFSAWESTMLTNLQKIIYIPDAASTPGANSVIVPPSQRHVETVQRAFRSSLYKAFDGMMQFARKPVQVNGFRPGDGLGINVHSEDSSNIPVATGNNANNADVRKLLTISNLQYLRHSLVPNLVSLFESNFSHTITADARTLRDALSQMSSQVFKAYVKPTLISVDALVHAGISDPTFATIGARPDNARPYIYSVLSVLVSLHTEVSSTTPNLTPQILSHCLEHISTTLVAAFTAKPGPFPLPHLMQSTLDVEFLAQTLSSYTTSTVTELQGKIYAVLDEKTDNEARVALQGELTGMRGTLKRLRDGNRTAYAGLKRPKAAVQRGRASSGRE